jgi:hypothetical protein
LALPAKTAGLIKIRSPESIKRDLRPIGLQKPAFFFVRGGTIG